MEKYEKPNMEVVDVQNEVILKSVNNCSGNIFGYSGGCSDCSSDGTPPR